MNFKKLLLFSCLVNFSVIHPMIKLPTIGLSSSETATAASNAAASAATKDTGYWYQPGIGQGITNFGESIAKSIKDGIKDLKMDPDTKKIIISFADSFAELTKKSDGATMPDALKTIGNALFEIAKKGDGPTMPDAITALAKSLMELNKKNDSPSMPEGLTHVANALFELAKKGDGPTMPQAISDFAKSLIEITKKDSGSGIGVNLNLQTDTNEALKKLANEGIQTKFSIDPLTIKTICTAGVGCALAVAGITLIYKELTKDQAAIKQPEQPKTWSQKITGFLKNGCVAGTAGLAAGLLLIAKSNTIAAYV
jgi:hypothetical protein